MISTAFLAIASMLAMDFGAIQPAPVCPQQPVVPAVVIAARTSLQPATSAVRDYSSVVYPLQAQSSPTNQNDGASIELTPEEAALMAQTNNEREAQGLGDLQIDPLLCMIARQHSQDMAQRGYFDHIAPGPGPASPMDRYLAALGSRPDYAYLGENIYFRSATDSVNGSAAQANYAFMHSEEHRANIMQPKFTKAGIGFYRDPVSGAFWVTEEFLRDAD